MDSGDIVAARPAIGRLREGLVFARGVSLVVVVAFVWLLIYPELAIARQAAEQRAAASSAPAPSEARQRDDFTPAVDALRETAQWAEGVLEAGESSDGVKQRFRQRKAALKQAAQSVRAQFARDNTMITGKNLPAVIQKRHDAAVAAFETKIGEALAQLDTALDADGPVDMEKEVVKLRQWLQDHDRRRSSDRKTYRRQRIYTFGPKTPKDELPARGLHKKAEQAQPPRTSVEQFRTSGLYSRPLPMLAAIGDFRFDGLAGASDPRWLAETPEVTISDTITAKAEELDGNPVEIHAWVRNNVAWIPTWGAMQTAAHTLSSQRGNAMDIASLEIALLRASNIPARYVQGTIEVSAERFKNWAGGFDTVQAAADYAASGGIPVTGIVQGGRIGRVRLEHIWVEAAVDYFPSRAAVNRSADSWIPLDASFKQYEYLEGTDAAAIAGLDPQTVAQQFIDSGTIDDADDFVQSLDPSVLENAQADAQTALTDYFDNELPDNATVGDVLGGRRIVQQDYATLPNSIPNRLTVAGARYDALPEQLQQRLTIGLGTDLFGQPANPVSFPWATVNGARITLSFSPASEADRQALQSLLPESEITDPSQLPSSIPAYLIDVVPELRIDGQLIQTGSAMQVGQDLNLAYTVDQLGYGPDTDVSPVTAGSYLHLVVAGGSVAPSRLASLWARVQATRTKLESADQQQLASLTREDVLGDLFHAGGVAYFGQFDALSALQARQQGVRRNLAPSVGTYGYEPSVSLLFGVPRAIARGGVVMDLDRVAWIQGADADTPSTARQRNIQTGALSSALEHVVPEQMFSTSEKTVQGISAVKALSIANAQGQRIYRITQDNAAEVLPKLNLSSLVEDEIRSSIAAGKIVTTHTNPVSVPGYAGAGYVILDPETGAGAWKIGGGQNGGFLNLDSLYEYLDEATFVLAGTAVDVGSFLGRILPRVGNYATALADAGNLLVGVSTVLDLIITTNTTGSLVRGLTGAAINLAISLVAVGLTIGVGLFLPATFIGAIVFGAATLAIGIGAAVTEAILDARFVLIRWLDKFRRLYSAKVAMTIT